VVILRNAVPHDLPEVVRLNSELGYQVTTEGIRPVFLHYLKNPDYYLLLAEKDGQVLGMVTFTIKHYLHREKPVLYIDSMVVKEAYRSQGIGRKMMEEVEVIAKERGCNSIELTSNKKRMRAHRFYRKLGFVETSLKFEKILE